MKITNELNAISKKFYLLVFEFLLWKVFRLKIFSKQMPNFQCAFTLKFLSFLLHLSLFETLPGCLPLLTPWNHLIELSHHLKKYLSHIMETKIKIVLAFKKTYLKNNVTYFFDLFFLIFTFRKNSIFHNN